MKVALDAFPLTPANPTGIPNYIKRLFMAATAMDSASTYHLYSKQPIRFPARPNAMHHIGSPGRASVGSFENTLWLFTQGVRLMKHDGVDLFVGTRQMLPPMMGSIRTLLVVYDLVWHYFPETMGTYNRLVLGLLGRRSIAAADHIVSVSDATTQALMDITGVPRSRITTIYPVAEGYAPLDREEAARYIAGKYGTSGQYALTVGTVEPRKNLKALLQAFARLKGTGRQLLVAGASGWKTTPIYKEYRRLGLSEREVKFLGYVPDEDMNRLYSGASVFLLSSVYEGFAMPPLEAMTSGAPAILSHPCVSKIASDAAILLDPHDVEGWQREIARVMDDRSAQERMREASIAHAARVTPERAARKLIEAMHAALGRNA